MRLYDVECQYQTNSNWKMYLFRFFGLTLLDDSFHEVASHKIFRIINLSWLLIHLTIFVFLVVSPSTEIFARNYSRMSEIIEMANYLFALATNLLILVHVQLVSGKDINWHEKLLELDRLLRDKFGVKINHSDIGRRRLWKVLITFIGAGACSVINMLYATQNNGYAPFLFAHNYFLKSIINLRYMQSLVRIDAIERRIDGVHDAVRSVVEHNTVEWKIVLVLDAFNRRHRYPVRKIDDANDVVLFKRFYATLFESMKLWENIFGWSLLMMISFTFVDLTSNLYWFFIAILDLDERIDLIDCVLEIVPSVVVISCLIYSSFSASRKAKQLINSATNLYTNTTSCYNKMVKEFLMQIHHERIENSANDFFIVDFHLFSAVSRNFPTCRWLMSTDDVESRNQSDKRDVKSHSLFTQVTYRFIAQSAFTSHEV